MQISIKMDDKQVIKKLGTISTGLKNFKEPLNKVGDDLVKFYGEKVFETQGSAIGSKWAGLSPSTMDARLNRRGHYSNSPIATSKILIWTGALKKGFQKKVSSVKLIVSNNVKYFKYNQGKRPMLGINREVINIVVKRFEEYIKKLIK